jgi:hypothetical protein
MDEELAAKREALAAAKGLAVEGKIAAVEQAAKAAAAWEAARLQRANTPGDLFLEGKVEAAATVGKAWEPRFAVYNRRAKRLDVFVEGQAEAPMASFTVAVGSARERGKVGLLGRKFKLEVGTTPRDQDKDGPVITAARATELLVGTQCEAARWVRVLNGEAPAEAQRWLDAQAAEEEMARFNLIAEKAAVAAVVESKPHGKWGSRLMGGGRKDAADPAPATTRSAADSLKAVTLKQEWDYSAKQRRLLASSGDLSTGAFKEGKLVRVESRAASGAKAHWTAVQRSTYGIYDHATRRLDLFAEGSVAIHASYAVKDGSAAVVTPIPETAKATAKAMKAAKAKGSATTLEVSAAIIDVKEGQKRVENMVGEDASSGNSVATTVTTTHEQFHVQNPIDGREIQLLFALFMPRGGASVLL